MQARSLAIKALIVTMASSCAMPTQSVIEKEVYVKCPVPDIPKTPRPRIQKDMSYAEKLKALFDYLFALEKENETLREVLETCRD